MLNPLQIDANNLQHPICDCAILHAKLYNYSIPREFKKRKSCLTSEVTVNSSRYLTLIYDNKFQEQTWSVILHQIGFGVLKVNSGSITYIP